MEDEPAITHMCRRVLGGMGFDVDAAENGKIARDMLAERHYDLCLVDLMMPVMRGDELYIWLKDSYPQQADRVIFTTGSVMTKAPQEFSDRYGVPVLLKPFTPSALKTIISDNTGKE